MSELTNDNSANVAIFGECMLEYLAEIDGAKFNGYAGDTFNTAVYLSRLFKSTQSKVSYVTALGDDDISHDMLAVWGTEGIETHLVSIVPDKSPGSYTVLTDNNGERSFLYARDQAAVRDLFRMASPDLLFEKLKDYAFFYLSGISIAIFNQFDREQIYYLVKKLYDAGVKIAFDSNYRPTLWSSIEETRESYNSLYPYIDMALVSYEDESELFADSSPAMTIERIAAHGVQEIVVKNGAEPCTVMSVAGVETYPVKQLKQQSIQDTTAAGDSFNAAYISARLSGYDIATAIVAAQQFSARVIQFPGAIIPARSTLSLAQLINNDHSS